MRLCALGAMAAALGACGSIPTAQEVDARIMGAFHRFDGQPVGEVVSRLGPPTEQQVVAGERWLSWSTDYIQSMTEFRCRFSVSVDVRGTIAASHYSGNRGGCTALSKPLL